MERIKPILKKTLAETDSIDVVYKRNLLKEPLQAFILDYIYSKAKYSELYFYGGSALRQCYNLPRLSEDLDFVDLSKTVKIGELATDLQEYFGHKTDLAAKATTQKFRAILKFPVLGELGLAANKSESDLLNLKVEVSTNSRFCRGYKTEYLPITKLNKSIIIKTFDLPTLMASKILAILNRRWEKRSKSGEVMAVVKGRDYYDLMWYFSKGVVPNMACLPEIKDMAELKAKLLLAIEQADARSVEYDLAALVEDLGTAKRIGVAVKEILKRNVESM